MPTNSTCRVSNSVRASKRAASGTMLEPAAGSARLYRGFGGSWCTLLLVLATLVLLASPSETAAAANTVVIRQLPGEQDSQLRDALENRTVTHILLDSDYVVGSQFDHYATSAENSPNIQLDRNVTISGVPGLEPPPILDFGFKMSVAELCDTCWVTLKHIVLQDERMGANAQIDLFLGQGSSVLWVEDAVRHRRVCVSITPAQALVQGTKRSPRFPAEPPAKPWEQVYGEEDVTFRGTVFPKTLRLLDYSVEFPRHFNGGYHVVQKNVSRVCHAFVGPDCLASRDADMCAAEAMQALLNAQAARAAGQQLSTGARAGIAVAACVVAATAAAVAALVCCRRRRRQRLLQQQQQQQSPQLSLVKAAGVMDVEKGGGSSAMPPPTCDASGAKDSRTKPVHANIPAAAAPAAALGPHVPDANSIGSGSGSPTAGPAVCGQPAGLRSLPLPPLPGWSGSLSSPHVCSSLADLRFGAFLGSGSFGRVYRARWGERDVAVKIMETDWRMSGVVDNEVALMMSCEHPNVVAAFHYFIHTHSTHEPDGSDGSLPLLLPPALPPHGGGGGGGSSAGAGMEPHDAARGGPPAASGSSHSHSSGRGGSLQPPCSTSYSSVDRPVPVIPGPHHLVAPPAPFLNEAVPGSAGDSGTLTHHQQHQQQQHQHQHQHQQHEQDHTQQDHQQQQERLAATPNVWCSCYRPTPLGQATSLLLRYREGGFWPAGVPVCEDDSAGVHGGAPGQLGGGEPGSSLVTTWLIQELCDAGTLAKQASGWHPGAEDDAQMIRRLLLLQDVARGLSYLHARLIVHGDLNARNVLVASNPASPCGLTAKLADLGLSRSIKQHNTHHTTCTVGTMSAMPPELLRFGRMSTAVDIYGFGVMMWEVYTRAIAFRELHYGQFFETVVLRDLRPPVAPSMPADYRMLMERCWATDPRDRPSAKALLECLGLMVADRQHSLGLPVCSNVGCVDSEFASSSSSVAGRAAAAAAAAPQPQQLSPGAPQAPSAACAASSSSDGRIAAGPPR